MKLLNSLFPGYLCIEISPYCWAESWSLARWQFVIQKHPSHLLSYQAFIELCQLQLSKSMGKYDNFTSAWRCIQHYTIILEHHIRCPMIANRLGGCQGGNVSSRPPYAFKDKEREEFIANHEICKIIILTHRFW